MYDSDLHNVPQGSYMVWILLTGYFRTILLHLPSSIDVGYFDQLINGKKCARLYCNKLDNKFFEKWGKPQNTRPLPCRRWVEQSSGPEMSNRHLPRASTHQANIQKNNDFHCHSYHAFVSTGLAKRWNPTKWPINVGVA